MKNKLLIGLLVAPFVLAGCGQKKIEDFDIDVTNMTLTTSGEAKTKKVTITPKPESKGFESKISFTVDDFEDWRNYIMITPLTLEADKTSYSYLFEGVKSYDKTIIVHAHVQDVTKDINVTVND